jgi:ABC-2 type transport system permease protein
MNLPPSLAITHAELRIMIRNKAVAMVALLVPLVSAFAIGLAPTPVIAAQGILFILLAGVYVTATTTLSARRRELFLKRLRSGAASDTSIIIGLLLPAVVVTCAQVTLMLSIASATKYALPKNIGLLVVAVLAGAIMFAGLAVGTSAFTKSAEQAQVTTMPMMIASIAGALLVTVKAAEHYVWIGRLLPGGAIVELITHAWAGTTSANVLPALLALGAWTFVGVAITTRLFKWEPRS